MTVPLSRAPCFIPPPILLNTQVFFDQHLNLFCSSHHLGRCWVSLNTGCPRELGGPTAHALGTWCKDEARMKLGSRWEHAVQQQMTIQCDNSTEKEQGTLTSTREVCPRARGEILQEVTCDPSPESLRERAPPVAVPVFLTLPPEAHLGPR